MNITLVYSGGVQNTGQAQSLGGFPSPVAVTPNKNNLFDDVTAQETTDGFTDYKCIYVFNDDSSLRFDVTLFVEYIDNVGATVQLGFLQQNEVQSIKFTQVPASGTFTLTIQGMKTPIITWVNDPNAMASAIQTAIRSITDCSVAVAAAGQFNYNITFRGILANKFIGTITVTDNLLLPSGTTPSIAQVTVGSPINTISPDTIAGTVPNGVPFTSVLAPGVLVGTLFPAEGFPLWIKRNIASGFQPVEGDGFNLHVKAVTSLNQS